MATKDQKERALKMAVNLATEHAKGGSNKTTPDDVLKCVYYVLLDLLDEVEGSSA